MMTAQAMLMIFCDEYIFTPGNSRIMITEDRRVMITEDVHIMITE
jgi:hypothetical protein